MPRARATIVDVFAPDWLGRRYGAAVVSGTINSYYPADYRFRAWTANGAKRRGDREIRRRERIDLEARRRYLAARSATGYGDNR